MSDNIYNQRIDYLKNDFLDENKLPDNPFELFKGWYKVALDQVVKDPNAMILSTLKDDMPRSRVVLLKNLDEKGFTYFTNYNSAKVQETNTNQNASLAFFWRDLERQIRIEGKVEKVTEKESDDYFMSRPEGSRIGAWASPQSKEIKSRKEIEDAVEEIKNKFDGKEVTRPENWGGLRLVPSYFEFWQGASSRLHDRIVYELIEGSWKRKRLAP
ncbi:MAG: pyridoxamine 5'-phosphate oxidase [Flavobacteriales bacterium]|nr:pyridoxamine 5'-phosphate oxidase [Flavobacteriales bacterium]|tara:strand:+ start:2491 stop:3132 length:642 start_codon:yes stop_codon:yes gene_type:complete